MGKGWGYYLKVGFHLFLIGLLAMIIGSIIAIPLELILGSISLISGYVVAGFTLLGLIKLAIGFLLMGYFVVRWKKWVFRDKVI